VTVVRACLLLIMYPGFSKYDLKRRKTVHIWNEKAIVKHYLASPSIIYDMLGAAPIDTVFRLYGSTQSIMIGDIASMMRMFRVHNAIEITEPLHLVIQRAAIYFPPLGNCVVPNRQSITCCL
jgi:hypothetical protein